MDSAGKTITVKDGYDMLYLTCCGIYSVIPEKERVLRMNLSHMRELAGKHSLSAITFMTAEPVLKEIREQSDAVRLWREDKDKAVRKEILMEAERRELSAFLQKEKINYVNLKGIVLKDMYPKFGQRQMSDNDILFDPGYRDKVREWFESRGYETVHFNKGHDDVYHKKPVYNFEMTVSLFSEFEDRNLSEYYKNIYGRLIKKDGSDYEYELTDEDFYIYFIAHSHKHYKNGGFGLRTLLDAYLYLKNKGEKMDWEYIGRELEKTGLEDAEKKIRELSQLAFSDPESCDIDFSENEYGIMLNDILLSSAYGSYEESVKRNIENIKGENNTSGGKAKLIYCLRRIFPPLTYYKTYYPFLYKYKIFIPFFVVYRIIFKTVKHRKILKIELDKILK